MVNSRVHAMNSNYKVADAPRDMNQHYNSDDRLYISCMQGCMFLVAMNTPMFYVY